jgi:hypothetical protein
MIAGDVSELPTFDLAVAGLSFLGGSAVTTAAGSAAIRTTSGGGVSAADFVKERNFN